MKFTERTRRYLQCRREGRDMSAADWEYVSEGGGKLWELHRGGRMGYRIVDAKVSCNGLGVWVLIQGEKAGNTEANG